MKTLDDLTSAYIEAAFWTESDDGDYLELAQIIYECERYIGDDGLIYQADC